MPQFITIGRAVRDTRARLSSYSDTPGLDTQVLLSHILQQPKSWVLAHPEATLNSTQTNELEKSVLAIEKGTPLPYVLGNWEFYGRSFKVTPDVLIPRPETELLVETALKWLAANPTRIQVADLGTGSGCIAVSLAANHPTLKLTAVDISAKALEIAYYNAARHTVSSQINFIKNDLLDNIQGPFDLICANPPYISTGTLHQLDVFGREPDLALDGGADGLDIIRKIFTQASGSVSSSTNLPGKLAQNGLLLIEIEASLGKSALALASRHFPAAHIHVLQDLAGLDRLISVENRV